MFPDDNRDFSDANIGIFDGTSAARNHKLNNLLRRGGRSEQASVFVHKVNLDQRPIEWEGEVFSQNKQVGLTSKIK